MSLTLFVVLAFVTAITLGPLFIIFGYLHLRRRSTNKQELRMIQEDINRIRVDIEDIKEQIADFIIKTG
jgi:hypothetical protein